MILLAVTIGVLSFSYVDLSVFSLDTLFYALCLLVVLTIFGGFGIRKILKEKEKKYVILLDLEFTLRIKILRCLKQAESMLQM